jgi:hypothetical protein
MTCSTERLVLRRFIALALMPVLSACAASTPNGETPAGGRVATAEHFDVAETHAHKCGRCHAPPEPKTRTREHLTDAFGRHQKRLHLTPAQWAAMVDYLEAPDASTAGHDR